MTGSCAIEMSEGGCARLSGELTFDSTPALYREMGTHIRTGAVLARIDLGGVTQVDSAGLALLLEWQASRKPSGKTLEIANAPSGLLRLAKLCEAVELLNLTGRDADK